MDIAVGKYYLIFYLFKSLRFILNILLVSVFVFYREVVYVYAMAEKLHNLWGLTGNIRSI